jgi:hypothetical protein
VRFAFYDRLSRSAQATYRASDEITTLPLNAENSEALLALGAAIKEYLAAERAAVVQSACQQLLELLALDFENLPPVTTRVLERRPVDASGELHGLYVPVNPPARGPAKISVWMRTAQKTKVVAPRTFVRTLLHEFCHHLDYEYFGFAETFHTEGFYKRESVLLVAVMGQPAQKKSRPSN